MVSGKETERQTVMKLLKTGLKEITLYKPSGEEWSSLELFEVLENKTLGRVPGILKGRSKTVIYNINQEYILDKGYKVDFLLYSPKLQGYMGVDIMKYPLDEDWSYLWEKIEEIEELQKSGVYETINVQRMGVLMVAPQGKDDLPGDEEEEDEAVFDFLESLEEAEFMPKPGILDLRKDKERLREPPL